MDASALGMPDISASHPPHVTEGEQRLRRIAGALGCSVESFRTDVVDRNGFGGASELLSLWLTIHDPAARSEILALARVLARADVPAVLR